MSAAESYRLSPRVRFRAVGDEGLLVNMDSGEVTVVNEVGLYLVSALAESACSPEQLVMRVGEAYDVAQCDIGRDIDTYLHELAAAGLVEHAR